MDSFDENLLKKIHTQMREIGVENDSEFKKLVNNREIESLKQENIKLKENLGVVEMELNLRNIQIDQQEKQINRLSGKVKRIIRNITGKRLSMSPKTPSNTVVATLELDKNLLNLKSCYEDVINLEKTSEDVNKKAVKEYIKKHLNTHDADIENQYSCWISGCKRRHTRLEFLRHLSDEHPQDVVVGDKLNREYSFKKGADDKVFLLYRGEAFKVTCWLQRNGDIWFWPELIGPCKVGKKYNCEIKLLPYMKNGQQEYVKYDNFYRHIIILSSVVASFVRNNSIKYTVRVSKR